MCQPRAKFCKILLASGSTGSIRAGCGCRVLWRAIQRVPPRSPTSSWKNSGKCNTGLRYCKNKYSSPCIYLSLTSIPIFALWFFGLSMFIGWVVDTTPGAATLGVVEIAPHRIPSNKLEKNAIIIATTVKLMARSQNYPVCNDSGRSRNSLSCEPVLQVRYNPIERNWPVRKNAIVIATTVKAHGKKSSHIEHECGCSLHI
jgi:hypothetical protein